MTNPAPMPENVVKPRQKRKKTIWLRLFRIAIAAAVAIALVYTIRNSSQQFSKLEFSFADIQYHWVAAAIVSYLVALLLSCCFWGQILKALSCDAPPSKVLLAFFVSQLGKYVPGKAMVVVLRTDLIRGPSVQTSTAAASVFVETLTWIFVGSLIACALIFLRFEDQVALKWTAAALAAVAGIATIPVLFRTIAAKLTRTDPTTFAGLNFLTMAKGWALMSAGWCFNAISLCFILRCLPDTEVTIGDFPLALACVSLATVAGFASLLPGGIGVRELVMIPLLGPRFGTPVAIIAAILIRLVWISAEIIGSGIIFLWHKTSHR